MPVQYFQSVIAIELGITGALLFQMRFFETRQKAEESGHVPDARLRLLVAVILGSTMFGSLQAIRHEGQEMAASLVMVGLAVSLLPILLRVLPPLTQDAARPRPEHETAVAIAGIVLYALVTAAAVVLISV